MTADEPQNGQRYVTHQRLAEVMDQHRNVEVPALRAAVEARIDRRATVERVARLESDVRENERMIATHEALLQQMRGMVTLAKFALGTSILGIVVALLAIADTFRR